MSRRLAIATMGLRGCTGSGGIVVLAAEVTLTAEQSADVVLSVDCPPDVLLAVETPADAVLSAETTDAEIDAEQPEVTLG